jgi:hypothetical protein
MSRSTTNTTHAAATGMLDRARGAAVKARPLAGSLRAAAGRGVHGARAWAAPHLRTTGTALQDTVAPKVSAVLSSAADRLEPTEPRRRWRKLAGISVLTAAGSAVAAVIRKRGEPRHSVSPEPAATDAEPAAEVPDATGGAGPDAAPDGQVSTSGRAAS